MWLPGGTGWYLWAFDEYWSYWIDAFEVGGRIRVYLVVGAVTGWYLAAYGTGGT